MCEFRCEHPDNQHALAVRPILSAAKAYAAQGAYVFPLHSPIVKDGEVVGCTCEHAKVTGYNGARPPQPDFVCSQPGKHPKIKDWEERATVDPDQIFKWFGRLWSIDKDRHGNDVKIIPNIGIACGKSNLLALDADSYKDAYTGLSDLGLDEECPTQISGGGGNHYIYRLAASDNYNNSSNGLSEGIDIRAHGGLIVAAPSLHGSGNRYQWEMGYSIEEIEAPPIPDSLRIILDTNITTYCTDNWGDDADDSIHTLQEIIDRHQITGNWNKRTNTYTLDNCPFSNEHDDGSYAGVLASGALFAGCHHSTCKNKNWHDFKEIYPMASEENEADTAPATRTLPKLFGLTDVGNGQRMVAQHGESIRYVPKWGKWLIWSGTRWEPDETYHIYRLAKETVQTIYDEARAEADDDKRKKIASFAIRSEAHGSIENMIKQARTELGIAVSNEMFDADHMLFNVANGTINLATGELQPHRQSDCITKLVDIEYDKAAQCPIWLETFLDTAFNGDKDMIEFLQRAVGYTMTGDVTAERWFFLYGLGGNGKSVFTNILTHLMGGYGVKSPTSMIEHSHGMQSVPADIARLSGARFTSVNEVEEGVRLNESAVKDLSSKDKLTARYMRQDYFEFWPTHTLWMYGNHKPLINGTDNGIWRRVTLVPFTVVIPDDKKDERLESKLLAEMSGILTWAVLGAMKWQESGIQPPQFVKDATTAYKDESSKVKRFITENCKYKEDAVMPYKELYAAYKLWCEEGNEKAESVRRFTPKVEELGYSTRRGNQNVKVVDNIIWIKDAEVSEDNEWGI